MALIDPSPLRGLLIAGIAECQPESEPGIIVHQYTSKGKHTVLCENMQITD